MMRHTAVEHLIAIGHLTSATATTVRTSNRIDTASDLDSALMSIPDLKHLSLADAFDEENLVTFSGADIHKFIVIRRAVREAATRYATSFIASHPLN